MQRTFLSFVAIVLSTAIGSAIHLLAAAAADPVKQLILPGESFIVDGRPAFIMLPPEAKRATPQPWVMYAPTLPGLPDEHEKWMHEQFLAAGVAVAGIDVGEAYGSPQGRKSYDALYDELTVRRGFAKKCCLLGRSRGGLWNSSWAIHNPEKVSGMAGIYPVFDLSSWPGVERAASAFKLSPEELAARLEEHNPIARIDVLAKARVPVFLIHGDDDQVVPLRENSAEVVRRYAAAGSAELIHLTIAAGQGHNDWPGFFQCQELVDFVVKAANVRSDDTPAESSVTEVPDIAAVLTPRPQHIAPGEGRFAITNGSWAVSLPDGPDHEACRSVLTTALRQAGATVQEGRIDGHSFLIGQPVELPDLPSQGSADEAYVLRITPTGVMARGASPAGILYAAQTLRQLLRVFSDKGYLPCLTIIDYPTFRMRGVYIEGGQERFGRIVDKDYLLEQIRRLSEFKMNTLVIECYNLFPFASFPACADEGTLSENDCQEILAESKRWHVTIVPSLQTLAQASELVWNCQAGVPYREVPAPGLMCPSNPDIYPFIRGLYRDLLQRFDDSPVIGVGCSEIDMQWKERYCPACRQRIDAGETVRDLLLGHAEKCIAAVHSVSAELGRPVRPLMWADEFYMYGPGKDWVGIERIPRDTVMGYWKYWADYAGIGGLLERGYDVLGISAMYNHTFYLADLSPDQPAKSWPPMEQTGTRNVTAMLRQAAEAREADGDGRFWGVATASFSKHRLRAFDSIWYGFILNGHAAWGDPRLALDDYQEAFTKAFARHFYDARTDEAADALAQAYARLDRCKSSLELANQILGDVVGVVDTQEPGYLGNTFMGAFRRCATLMAGGGDDLARVMKIRDAARQVVQESAEVTARLDAQKPHIGRDRELADLWLAGEKIAAHAQRQLLMIETQDALLRAADQPADRVREILAGLPQRWTSHRERVERILDQSKHLYSRGDPLGLAAVLVDIANIESELQSIIRSGRITKDSSLLGWESLDHRRVAQGHA
jgi:pimeloyl-ACP methyl ester carboxylesterase